MPFLHAIKENLYPMIGLSGLFLLKRLLPDYLIRVMWYLSSVEVWLEGVLKMSIWNTIRYWKYHILLLVLVVIVFTLSVGAVYFPRLTIDLLRSIGLIQ